ncbi:S8 family peptidase [Halonatronum saccharophilum]|uniref:S8 family peptidase n=1 Tax=Halonatronum saccharophilum TaxID=150060 RepID=UPI0004B0ED38|nr:S8 family peptidase [Halonatronum saccharophilum]
MRRKFLVALTILIFLSGCTNSDTSFIQGHITLSNTLVDWEEFKSPTKDNANSRLEINNLTKESEESKESQFLIKFEGGSFSDQEKITNKYELTLVDKVDSLGVKVFKSSGKIEDEELLKELSKNEFIEYIELNTKVSISSVEPKDFQYHKQWNYPLVSLPQAWEVSNGSSEIVVAVLDTGIYLDHREFKGLLLDGKNFTVSKDDERRYNPNDFNGHGTHVAGIIGALSNNNTGQVVGSNWDISLLPVKVLDDRGFGSNLEAAQGVVWATNQGAQIINLSLGSKYPSKTLEYAIRYAYSKGVIIIAAAGNYRGSYRPMELLYPAAYPETIAVGSVDYDLKLSDFSYVGREIDFVAPGNNIISTYHSNLYRKMNGTSMAAPHVSGVAALLLAEGVVNTSQEIKEQLRLTSQSLGNVGWDYRYGYGLINAHAALTDAKITDAVVFLGDYNEKGIKVLTQMYGVDKDGLYSIPPQVKEGKLFAWIDTNGNGKIDKGDYFASTSNKIKATSKIDLILRLVEEKVEYQVIKK